MTLADLAFGLRLSAQNHWNQLEADWRRQLDLEPDGCFIAERDGNPLGTACCCVFGDVAWISLVLVEQAQRGRGIGTELMRHAVQYLDERGVATIRLDATPLGQPVYEKLGFKGDFSLTRFEGVMPPARIETLSVEQIKPEDLAAVCQMDEATTHTSREKLLRNLVEAALNQARKIAFDDELRGYYLARPGANAWQIGPMQGRLQAGGVLLRDMARQFAGKRVYLDVPTDHAAAIEIVQTLGMTPQRSFLRMTRGRPMREDLNLFWTSFGAEKG